MLSTVRDAFGIWGHPAGAHDSTSQWKLPRNSRMTPVEGAYYMGIPNMIMVWLWSRDPPEPEPSWPTSTRRAEAACHRPRRHIGRIRYENEKWRWRFCQPSGNLPTNSRAGKGNARP